MTNEERDHVAEMNAKLERIDERTARMLESMEDHKETHRALDVNIGEHGKSIARLQTALTILAWIAGTCAAALISAGAALLVQKLSQL